MAIQLVRVCAFFLPLALWTSCAFVDRKVAFDYSAPARETKGVVEAAAAVRETFWLRRVEDARTETHRVGEIRNGFGMHTADVHAKGDAAAWLRKALVTEFGRCGMTEAPAEAEAAILLEARLVHVHVTAMFEYEGEVHLAAAVHQAGRPVLQASYVGKGGAGLNWTATDASFEETLDLALQDAVLQLVADLRSGRAGTAATGAGHDAH